MNRTFTDMIYRFLFEDDYYDFVDLIYPDNSNNNSGDSPLDNNKAEIDIFKSKT